MENKPDGLNNIEDFKEIEAEMNEFNIFKRIEELNKEINAMIGDKYFKEIEAKINEFNIFKILKSESSELKHSNILAWLLNPNESHKFGTLFLKDFLVKFIEIEDQELLSETKIFREYKNIDLLLLNDSLNFCIALENKFYSKEHSNQLLRYAEIIENDFKNYDKYFIYLSLNGDKPSDNRYKILTYNDIIQLIKNKLNTLKDERSKELLNDYIKIVEPIVNPKNYLNKLADKIYQKYKPSLDFIFDEKSDELSVYKDKLIEIINENENLVIDDSNKTFIRFTTKNLIKYLERSKENCWTKTKYNFLFEIKNYKEYFYLDIVFSPCEENNKYFNYVDKNKTKFFNLKKNKWRYRRLFQIEKNNNNYFKNIDKFEKKFIEFLEIQLKSIEKEYRDLIQQMNQ